MKIVALLSEFFQMTDRISPQFVAKFDKACANCDLDTIKALLSWIMRPPDQCQEHMVSFYQQLNTVLSDGLDRVIRNIHASTHYMLSIIDFISTYESGAFKASIHNNGKNILERLCDLPQDDEHTQSIARRLLEIEIIPIAHMVTTCCKSSQY
jgi:hypothetical protein